MDSLRGRTERNRPSNTRPTARALLALAVALSVVLAGCTGMGGLGDLGDGDETDGTVETGTADDSAEDGDGGTDDAANETEGTDGDDATTGGDDDADDEASGGGATDSGADEETTGDADALVSEGDDGESDWFDLSQPGYYACDLAGIDEETGEQVTGHLVYDVEDAGGEEVTTSIDYEFGGDQYQSTTTGSADEVAGQLFITRAHAPVLALQSASLMYYFEMGFSDPAVGNRMQTTTEEGTQVTGVTEERSYAGVECLFVETTLDGELSQQSCLRGAEGGIAPYVATYTD